MIVLGQKNILSLDIPVHESLFVDVLQGQANLQKPVQYFVLGEILSSSSALFNSFGQVSTLTEFHYDAQLPPFVDKTVLEWNNARMMELLEHLRFL